MKQHSTISFKNLILFLLFNQIKNYLQYLKMKTTHSKAENCINRIKKLSKRTYLPFIAIGRKRDQNPVSYFPYNLRHFIYLRFSLSPVQFTACTFSFMWFNCILNYLYTYLSVLLV